MVETYKPKPLNKKEIVDGFALMLPFMGYEYTNDDPVCFPKGYYFNDEDGDYLELHHCNIDEDWNLIHKLLAKIKTIECSGVLQEHKSTLFNTLLHLHIEDVFRDISTFIFYYNKNKS